MSRRLPRAPRWLLLGVLAFAACQHAAPYPAPGPRTVPALQGQALDGEDRGDVARIRTLESQCRTRLSGQSAAASISALDRVHEVLGSSCDLETVDHDPLHWRLRCRSDALFDSGQYALSAKPARCAELGNRNVPSWQCVGAVLAGLLDAKRKGALASLDAAVLGHVDMQPLRPGSESHVCSELQQRLGYAPEPPWTPVADDASDEERLYANNQLAWCRAASVADALRRGLLGDEEPPGAEAAAGTTKAAARSQTAEQHTADTAAGLPLSIAVLGVGTSWLGSQPGGACPSTGKTPTQQKDCVDARRVDLLLHFTPSNEATTSSCDREGDDARTALHCLQQCLESEAVGRIATDDARPRATGLFQPRQPDAQPALPAGWYLTELSADPGRNLDMGHVCSTLGISAGQCPPR